jgi:hypothetical protein
MANDEGEIKVEVKKGANALPKWNQRWIGTCWRKRTSFWSYVLLERSNMVKGTKWTGANSSGIFWAIAKKEGKTFL